MRPRAQVISTTLFALLSALGTAACTPAPQPSEPAEATSASVEATAEPVALEIYAAASLTAAFEEIGAAFAAEHPGVEPRFTFGGSQQLATQIKEGAPADVFASANKRQMEVVIAAGAVVSGTERTFARNRLVVIYPAQYETGVRSLADLAKPDTALVLAAQTVPVGAYAQEFLAKASAEAEYTAAFSPTVMANVVSFESDVNGVVGKVALGEADAGIVYSSDLSGAFADKLGSIPIPDDLNVIASYPIAALAASPHQALAKDFVDYVRSPKGQEVLVAHGFISTTGDASGAAPGSHPLARYRTPVRPAWVPSSTASTVLLSLARSALPFRPR